MTTKEFIKKIITWQLLDFPQFEHMDNERKVEYLKRIESYRDGLTPKALTMSDDQYEDLKKIANFKLEYFLQVMEEMGMAYTGSSVRVENQEKFLRDLV